MKIILLSLLAPILLVSSNIFIYLQTKSKISVYNRNPPFFALDFTRSNSINIKSSINHLLDSDPNTFWIKESDIHPTKDLEIELRLTHYYSETGYKKKNYSKLYILGCKSNQYSDPNNLDLELFIREAINVDKVLKLPEEYILANYSLGKMENNQYSIDLKQNLTIHESSFFPENMYIIGVRLKMKPTKSKLCLSQIYLGD